MSLLSNPVVAQLAVEGTLWSLGLFSIATWALIALKGTQLYRSRAQDKRFKKAFWASESLDSARQISGHSGPVARVASAAFLALSEADKQHHKDLQHTGTRQELLERYLRQQIQKERRSQESGLAILASIGSTAPFVGLFGTVWGILDALVRIGATGSASLDVVAGPIGEALVATGVGIAVAVPAVLGYNFFIRNLKLSTASQDDFATDILNLTQKAAFRIQVLDKSATQNTRFDERTEGAA